MDRDGQEEIRGDERGDEISDEISDGCVVLLSPSSCCTLCNQSINFQILTICSRCECMRTCV